MPHKNAYFVQLHQYILDLNPIAYWPLWDAEGTVSNEISGNFRNGTYSSDVSTWPVGSGCGDGYTAPQFDGANDYVDIFTPSFDAAFDGNQGTVLARSKVSGAGVWTDSNYREIVRILVDGSNYVILDKTNVNNQVRGVYSAGGVIKAVLSTVLNGSLDWFSIAITWSATADEVILYINGSQVGSIQTGLGVWAGTPGANTTCIGAAGIPPSFIWDGYIAHVAIWDVALTADEIAKLSIV